MRRRSTVFAVVAALLATVLSGDVKGQPQGPFGILPDLVTARSFHQATALADGRVLLSGGAGADVENTNASELYLPDQASFVATAALGIPRSGHSATLLAGGDVLIAGGSSDPFEPVASAERFDPAQGAYQPAAAMLGPRSLHTATLLPDGRVLIVGGLSGGAGSELATAELYDPPADAFSLAGSMASARAIHTATLLADGRVLVVGGAGPTGEPVRSEFFDPLSNTFSLAPFMVFPRFGHAASPLADGRILITGGRDGFAPQLEAAEIFDPSTNGFHVTGAMSRGRNGHTATLLPDGRVLVVGGIDAPALGIFGAELYNYAAGSFASLPSVAVPRNFHTASLLPDGRVLIAGGSGPLAAGSAERFTPPPSANREVALVAGWNFVSWTGDTTPVAVAIAATPAISDVFTWDAGAQVFLVFRRGGPSALNTLTTIGRGAGLSLLARQPSIWSMPDGGLPRAVSLSAGFNLGGWTGHDGAAIDQVAAEIGPSLVAIYLYDPLTTSFRVFRSAGPAVLNTAKTLNHGDSLWLLLDSPALWQQPLATLS
jgi:hypothetical protein